MRYRLFCLLSSLFLFLTMILQPQGRSAATTQAQETTPIGAGDDVLVEKVRKSIRDAITFLKGQQRNGTWEAELKAPLQRGGGSALVLLALLEAGVPTNDPVIQRGLKALRDIQSKDTYTVGLQTMVFVKAGEKNDGELILKNVRWLLDNQLSDGWGYEKKVTETGGDNSNSQYALLGLHAAMQAGYEVPAEALQKMQQFYLQTQLLSRELKEFPNPRLGAGWAYKRGMLKPSMTMTAAGVCNLIITGQVLPKDLPLLADGSDPNCGRSPENLPVRRGLNWLGDNLPAELTRDNINSRLGVPFYCLYGLERTGRLTGQRYFGEHDWYEMGCRYLVVNQKANGSWEPTLNLDISPVVATSFGLLFLSKGRTPVLISKLAFGALDWEGWNNKRNDLRYLVDFTSRELFKGIPLAWQNFDMRRSELRGADRKKVAAQLLQSPVVFFHSHNQTPRGEYRAILKEYIENGGFLVAENCCGKDKYPTFDKEMESFVQEVFGPDAQLQKLEPEHPVWTSSGKFAVSPKEFPLYGVKQGCKTVMIYSPVALAGHWEYNDTKSPRGKQAFELGANILAYATGLEPPRPRLSRVTLTLEERGGPVRRGYLKVGQLRHEGDWQPAPRAMSNLMTEARRVGLDVYLSPSEVFPSTPRVKEHRFLYLHGRKSFKEDPASLSDLRFALKSGTLLLADACCGSEAFDTAFKAFLNDLFAKDKLKLQPIPADDDLFSAELNGSVIRTVRRRVPGDRPEFRSLPPDLQGVKYRNRWVVIYSRWDLGCALERHSSPDCLGHDHESALRLGRAAVLYALTR